MRYSRQNKILELINNYDIDTQGKLAEMLENAGFDVTQATISRDIKELHLIKTLSPKGKYKYTVETTSQQPVSDRFVKIFKETLVSVSYSGNIIVLKTLSGCASAAAEAIDALDYPNVIGTIAGDNTIMLVADGEKNVPLLVSKFDELLK